MLIPDPNERITWKELFNLDFDEKKEVNMLEVKEGEMVSMKGDGL